MIFNPFLPNGIVCPFQMNEVVSKVVLGFVYVLSV